MQGPSACPKLRSTSDQAEVDRRWRARENLLVLYERL
jgi:hypothetical protein